MSSSEPNAGKPSTSAAFDRGKVLGAFQGLLIAGLCAVGGFLFNGAGHGTTLPLLMYIGPVGLCLAVPPIAYAASGANGRLTVALAVVIAAFIAHVAGAVLVYALHPEMQSQLRNMGGFTSRALLCYAIFAATMDLLPAVTLTVKLVRASR